MRNLKKISMVVVAILATLLILGGVVNAATLTLKVTSDKKELTVGDQVTITVDWTEKMQAASFVLNYDKDKVEYVSSSIADTYIGNDKEKGKLGIDWVSIEEIDMTKITFTFKAKSEGTVNFSTEIDGGFADGNVVKPDSYDVKTYGATAVTLKAAGNTTPTPTPTPTPAPTQKPATTPAPTATAKAPTVLPKAGDSLNILVAIPVLLAVTVLTYVQIRKYKEI